MFKLFKKGLNTRGCKGARFFGKSKLPATARDPFSSEPRGETCGDRPAFQLPSPLEVAPNLLKPLFFFQHVLYMNLVFLFKVFEDP